MQTNCYMQVEKDLLIKDTVRLNHYSISVLLKVSKWCLPVTELRLKAKRNGKPLHVSYHVP